MRTAILVLGFCLAGCFSSAPTVPVTPANQAQITSCENTATLHDGYVVAGFVVGGAGAGLGASVAAVGDPSVKTGLGIGAAGAAAIGVTLAALGELTASNFANSNCSAVVGPLPAGPLPATKAPDETTVTVSKP